MAAMAGALGVRLEKRGAHVLNARGAAPAAADVGRAVRIARAASVVALGAAAVLPAAARRLAEGGALRGAGSRLVAATPAASASAVVPTPPEAHRRRAHAAGAPGGRAPAPTGARRSPGRRFRAAHLPDNAPPRSRHRAA